MLIDDAYYVTTLGLYHVIIFGVVVPFLALRGRRQLTKLDGPINRLRHFQVTSVMLTLFAALSILTAGDHGMSLFHLDGRRMLVGLPVGLVAYAVAVVLMRPRWRNRCCRQMRSFSGTLRWALPSATSSPTHCGVVNPWPTGSRAWMSIAAGRFSSSTPTSRWGRRSNAWSCVRSSCPNRQLAPGA